ncbi:hypothetical protein EV182_004034, partial [Spiromyces aspiralis]
TITVPIDGELMQRIDSGAISAYSLDPPIIVQRRDLEEEGTTTVMLTTRDGVVPHGSALSAALKKSYTDSELEGVLKWHP